MYLPGPHDTQAYKEPDRIDYTPGGAVAAGDIINVGGSVFGYCDSPIEASRQGALALAGAGIRYARKATATVFAVGDTVMWDYSAQLAVQPALTLDGANDLPLGICVIAAGNGPNAVAFLPFGAMDRYNVLRPFVYNFDCEGAVGDTDEHILIPAWQNRVGLVFLGAIGLVTEAFAGATEDQGIVTIEDEDDNAIATLTPSDGGADAVGDIIVSSIHWGVSATGTAWKTVAAGKAVQAFVSQQTTGAGKAGKMSVYLVCIPIV